MTASMLFTIIEERNERSTLQLVCGLGPPRLCCQRVRLALELVQEREPRLVAPTVHRDDAYVAAHRSACGVPVAL